MLVDIRGFTVDFLPIVLRPGFLISLSMRPSRRLPGSKNSVCCPDSSGVGRL